MDFPILNRSIMVPLGGNALWRNRSFLQWHGPCFSGVASSNRLSCPNDYCPYGGHIEEDTFCDPLVMELFQEQIQPGRRILMLIDYASRQHVSLVTFRQTEMRGSPRFGIQEKSANFNFFRPTTGLGAELDVQIHSVQYLAVLRQEVTAIPFGKYGGISCFKKELSRITGVPVLQIQRAMQTLGATAPLPLRLRPTDRWAILLEKIFFQERNIAKFRDVATLLLASGPLRLMDLIIAYTQRGEWQNLQPAFAGWIPSDMPTFRTSMIQAVTWYLQQFESEKEQVKRWWELWDTQFKIGPPPVFWVTAPK